MAKKYKSQSWWNAFNLAKSYVVCNASYEGYIECTANLGYGKRVSEAEYKRLQTEHLLTK